MDDKRIRQHLEDVDRVLIDVREHLDRVQEQGEIYELRALQLLLEVTKVLHSQHDTRQLITLILDSALSFAEADRAFLMLFDDRGALRFKMGRTYAGQYLTPEQFSISSTIVDETLRDLKPVILLDAQNDARYSSRQSIMDLALRTVMATPLRVGERVLGVIYVDSQRPLIRYSRHHLNVMIALAEQAAVALANVEKFETHTE